MKLFDATPEKQCDNCAHQEGRHYCLHHGQHVRNMDIVRCLGWTAKADDAHLLLNNDQREGGTEGDA